jgi:hypothetical protein
MAKSLQREIELRPDGWERFNRAVTAAAKSGPKHRAAKQKPTVKAKRQKKTKVHR